MILLGAADGLPQQRVIQSKPKMKQKRKIGQEQVAKEEVA